MASGHESGLRTVAWSGAPILDICAVKAHYGDVLLLAADGGLHGIDFDAGTCVQLSSVALPRINPDDSDSYFGNPRHKLHASSDGSYAAVVVDMGQHGLVAKVSSGAVTMSLDGGNYYEDTVPFSACFIPFHGRDVLIHRTDWNRLDVSDPASGELLTDRHIAPYESVDKGPPAHYLDYFHGRLRPSPDGSRLFDDGWVWHPVSIPRVFSITDWLTSSLWESEDGGSVVHLTQRDDWSTPSCWINNQELALWRLKIWDEDDCEEKDQGPGARILQADQRDQWSNGCWPMESEDAKVLDLFSDGKCLYIASEKGTSAWDIASRSLVAELPGFTARVHDRARKALLAFESDVVVECLLSQFSEK